MIRSTWEPDGRWPDEAWKSLADRWELTPREVDVARANQHLLDWRDPLCPPRHRTNVAFRVPNAAPDPPVSGRLNSLLRSFRKMIDWTAGWRSSVVSRTLIV